MYGYYLDFAVRLFAKKPRVFAKKPRARRNMPPPSQLRAPLLDGGAPTAAAIEWKRSKKTRAVMFIPFSGAVAEASSFPHEPRCVHCKTMLRAAEARWGTGLCDGCYEKCRKTCIECSASLPMHVLHWNLGLCDSCYDDRKQRPQRRSNVPLAEGFDMGVRTCITAQLVFYMAPAVMQPSLYLEVQRANWRGFSGDAASSYAVVLTTATVVAMAAPIPFGYWAERRGEREIYFGVTIAATLAALVLIFAPEIHTPVVGVGIATFAGAWGTLSAPLSLRGVRAAYFARRVAPSELSRAGQLASAAGLVGSVAGPLLAALSRNAFVPAAIMAAIAHAFAAAALYAYLPPRVPANATHAEGDEGGGEGGDGKGGGKGGLAKQHAPCERCARVLTDAERRYGTSLCDRCYDTWFRDFKRRVLLAFCVVAALLEFSMNAAVVAPFQPIAVEHFGWGSDQIAQVNLLSATLSVFVSIAVAQYRLNEWMQVIAAAALYASSTTLVAWPPMAEWRLVLALVLGLKAQILFMAPFTAAFSRLIGGTRVTNGLTTILCLAPLIGAALGTAMAPLLIPFAGTPLFLVTSVPALIALLLLVMGWKFIADKDAKEPRAPLGSSTEKPTQPSWTNRLEGAAKTKPASMPPSPFIAPTAEDDADDLPDAPLVHDGS